MTEWECGVCGYIHKGSEPPEKCPVCEAPAKMFTERVAEKQQVEEQQVEEQKVEEQRVEEQRVEDAPPKNTEVKQWRCTVSGYVHTGVEPPAKCPVCEATAEQFEEVVEKEEEQGTKIDAQARRWRCTVCGYVHTGDEPPESCPVCAAPKKMFVEIDSEGKALGEIVTEKTEPAAASVQEEKSMFDRLGELVLNFHLHPITVHFPNGILPAAFLFMVLALFFDLALVGEAAYFNLIFVLVMLPVVIFTGYLEWQKRYKGAKTAVFITKIICSIIVLASVNVLVFWPLIDSQVTSAASPSQKIYLAIAGLALGAAGIAGHLGGKLVFGARK
jgi:rubrerythrin/uncharacterized membrane protein